MYLGSISFETYALHWPLMLTVEAGLFLWFRTRLSYDVSALLAFVITIVVIYVASILLNLFIRWSGKLLVKGIKKIKKEKMVEKQEEFNN